jgi:hypothetical protein
MKIEPNRRHCGFYCHSDYGPTFGDDINIINNPNTTMDSYSDLSQLIHILVMNLIQMKGKHFCQDRIIFNWMKLKFMKKSKF